MRKKFKITFDVDVDYPNVKQDAKKLSKDFNKWLVDWSKSHRRGGANISFVPLLVGPLKGCNVRHISKAKVKVKVVSDGDILLDEKYDEVDSDDC